jgi:hypothetical protein
MDNLRGKTVNGYKSHCIEAIEANPMDQCLATFHFNYYISPLHIITSGIAMFVVLITVSYRY